VVLLKTIIFTIVVPGSVAVLVPYYFFFPFATPHGFVRYSGLVPIGIGAAIYFRCAFDFTFAGKGTPAPIDPPKQLVVRGLYRYVRNPMYAGVTLVLLGEALLFGSLSLAEYACAVFLLFSLFVLLYEEPALRHKFGKSYQIYCEKVPRWLPSLAGRRGSG
jgi:protein-S-isoprenylcysteine O-methyltransferase Ste14